jgi:uncharacterized protein YpmS
MGKEGGNGTWKWIAASFLAMATLFLTLFLTIRAADVGAIEKQLARNVDDLIEIKKRVNLQDTTQSRMNTEKALDLQWKIAVAKNIEAIMDELKIPESRRAYIEQDSTSTR